MCRTKCGVGSVLIEYTYRLDAESWELRVVVSRGPQAVARQVRAIY